MPIMTVDDVLRVEPGMDQALLDGDGGVAEMDDEIEILGTKEIDTATGKVPWTRIRLSLNIGTCEGWVRSAHVDPEGVVPGGPIEKLKFANQCWVEALFSDANPHYVAAIAEMRSATSNGQQAGTPGPLSGPFRFTQAEWDAGRAVPEFELSSYSATDIADWRMQVVLFTLMTHRSEAAITAGLNAITAGRRPSAAELYLAQLIGANAAVAALTKVPSPTIKEAFDGVAVADQAKDRPLGESDFSKIVARYAEVLDTGSLKAVDAIDRIVARLDPVLTTTKADIISAGDALLGTLPDGGTLDGATDPFPPLDPHGGTAFDQKAPVVMRRLLEDFPVFKDFHAAAILGNIGEETGGFTQMQEIRPRKGVGGLGWLQWTDTRRDDFVAFCQPPLSTASDEGNYAFMRFEMRGKERRAREFFEVTGDLDSATEVFMSKYERPGALHLPVRKTFARRALGLFHNAGGGVGGGHGVIPGATLVLSSAVQAALSEMNMFARQSGSVVLETQEPLRARVLQYFRFVDRGDVTNPAAVRWSAAFISFVLNAGGVTRAQFPFSASHSVYILAALANRIANRMDAPVVYFDKNEMAPRVGDLIGFSDDVQNRADLERMLPDKPFHSHTNLVTEVSSGKIKAIGGNVTQSIRITNVNATPEGKIIPADKHFFLLRMNM